LLDCKEQLITIVCLSKGKDLVKNTDAAIGAKVADIIKKHDFWDQVENVVQMSQLIEKIMNITSNKHLIISLKSMSLI